ncbi:hypothetical protein BaRGS_00034821 [Batillaria attramentaria]|uniref:Uncharacterized protein n=1 Tax=Batillaria attramentaria TaxID=370345 RepID=A0ABD0JGH0_9CAEN
MDELANIALAVSQTSLVLPDRRAHIMRCRDQSERGTTTRLRSLEKFCGQDGRKPANDRRGRGADDG